jgi:AbrB family looped-hinge helix DNA binding protein
MMTAQTKMSGKGQVVIPKAVREALNWPPGTQLEVERLGGAVTLRPAATKQGQLTLEEFIARRPKYEGPPKSLEEIDEAMAGAMAEHFRKEYKICR